MSAQPMEKAVGESPIDKDGHPTDPDETSGSSTLEPAADHPVVEVRRNALVSAVLGAAASAIAIAYLWRGAESGSPFDWLLCLVMALTGVVFLHSLLDSRTPLLVVDEMGVRIRLGNQWRGLPWEAIDRVAVQPRRGALRDGHLTVILLNPTRAVEGLDTRARRHAQLNRKLYGAALAVPLGITTRTGAADDGEVSERVARLSQGRTEVVTVLPEPAPADRATSTPEPAPDAADRAAISADPAPAADRRPRWLRRGRAGTATPDAAEQASSPAEEAERAGSATAAVPLRAEAFKEQVTLRIEEPKRRASDAARSMQERVNPVDRTDSRVRVIAKLGDPVAPLVIGDFQPEPAYDPVIGPELAAARTRVGLSVDELADRTRIRPHVIESIEVDDFTPCGGDFYARGHIRTLARVLGKNAEVLLEHFDARYAVAPVSARKVFEAELATGMGGQVRRPYTGPNWTALVGAVLALILVWAGVRLFAGDGNEVLETPPPVLNGSAGLGNSYDEPRTAPGPRPLPTTLTAASAGAHVEVRDGDGTLVFEGDLVIGEVKRLRVVPPVTVSSDNAGAVEVRLGQQDQGLLGEPDQPATRTYQDPRQPVVLGPSPS